MTVHTKELINLSGQLDWRIRNGRISDSLVTVKAIEYRLKHIKEELDIFQKEINGSISTKNKESKG